MKKLLLLAIVVLGISAVSFGQVGVGVSATATASANIIVPITIANAGDMNFGTVAVNGTTGGTVVLTPASTRSTGGDGGVTLPNFNVGTVSAAHFAIEGAPNYTYSITLPADDHIVKSGTNTMIVNNFKSSPATTGTLNASGKQTVDVGATLNVTAGQAAGSYISEAGFEVTVNYN